MNYRHAQIMVPQDLTAGAGTHVLNIDIDKPISRIWIRFKTTKVVQLMSAPSPANIPKIELVDGSTVLHSLTGYENQALAYYSHPGIVMDHGQHYATASEVDLYLLSFGRYLWDDQLAFLANRFANPQLKITYDENLSDLSCESNEMEIWADIFDEKAISPLGFLMPVEHYAFTPGTSGSYETITLPEDRPIRQILVRAHYDGYEPWYNMAEARFDEGTLDRIPWEYTSLEYYYRRMKGVWPMIKLQICATGATGGNTIYIPQSDFNVGFAGAGMGGTMEIYHTNAASKGGKLSYTTSTQGIQFSAIAFGYLPWSCFQFPMGKQDIIDDWYNPAGKKPRLRLRSYTGGSSSTCQVVLEELYRY